MYSLHLRGIFRGRVSAVFFVREGKGREREKGLVGIYPLDCTTSTEWATKIHRKGKGKSGGGNWAKHSSGHGEKIMILKSGCCFLCLTLYNQVKQIVSEEEDNYTIRK